MRENDVLFGFRVTRMRVFPELGGALVELEHEKTGAAVCWLNRPDENMAFILSFRTPSTDSSGSFIFCSILFIAVPTNIRSGTFFPSLKRIPFKRSLMNDPIRIRRFIFAPVETIWTF